METGTKLRILYLYQYLLRHSDVDHPISTGQLIKGLKEQYDIDTNRNTLANDLAMLNKSGFNIEVIHSQSNSYYIDTLAFDTAELKIMIDAVSSSKFITEKKSKILIEKLLSLTSDYKAKQLRRHIYVDGRVKSENEKGYYIVDRINEAIDTGRKIRFQYADYGLKKRKVLRHNGEYYIVSPYALIWDGDYYYLLGYGEKRGQVQSFRLDRIYRDPEILEEKTIPAPKSFDISNYSQAVFRMYDTDKIVRVSLLCKNHIMNAIIDRFGKRVRITEVDEGHFTVNVTVCPSPTFYRWVFGWNGDMKILGPENVKEEYREMARRAAE
ncbi:MAG: WYL domain-containing protein [Lachnospiraceae bacterium]|nr:WYL domain-containing protein [Lachnospiraceae bacterium]